MLHAQTADSEINLANQVKVVFKGLSFFADDENPVLLQNETGEETQLFLRSYKEDSDSVKLFFSDDVTLEFFQFKQGDGLNSLSIFADFPESFSSIFLPCALSPQYSFKTQEDGTVLLTSKGETFVFSCDSFDEKTIGFSQANLTAKCEPYIPSHEVIPENFSFQLIAGLSGTSDAELAAICAEARTSLADRVGSLIAQSRIDSLSEMDITAYVAELASRGRYSQAVSSIPDTFRRGSKRTYISAPFFDNLVSMSRSLAIQTEKFSSLVKSSSPDVFATEGMTSYILREKNSPAIRQLIDSVSQIQSFSATQAAGALDVYSELSSKEPVLASILEKATSLCVSAIEKSCVLENGSLKLSKDDGTFFDVYDAVFVGTSLAKYGKVTSNMLLVQAGNLLVHTALSSPDLSVRTISSIYRMIAPDNTYFPHAEILGWYGDSCVWAWTCAQSISCAHDNALTANILIEFPHEQTHYVIFSGVPDFRGKIEIQGMMFRTDPNFETYNSSGYVYQGSTRSLFLKSRHKSRTELVRLFFDASQTFESTADLKTFPKRLSDAKAAATATAASQQATSN